MLNSRHTCYQTYLNPLGQQLLANREKEKQSGKLNSRINRCSPKFHSKSVCTAVSPLLSHYLAKNTKVLDIKAVKQTKSNVYPAEKKKPQPVQRDPSTKTASVLKSPTLDNHMIFKTEKLEGMFD
jgi:hypothetical protein